MCYERYDHYASRLPVGTTKILNYAISVHARNAFAVCFFGIMLFFFELMDIIMISVLNSVF